MDSRFDAVESVLEDVRAGRLVIVTDDEKRENEGDLVCAAEKITPELVNFMITHARGLVCAPITEERAKELNIYREPSTDHFKTAFTESVDVLTGTTGISAFDRAAMGKTCPGMPKSSPLSETEQRTHCSRQERDDGNDEHNAEYGRHLADQKQPEIG